MSQTPVSSVATRFFRSCEQILARIEASMDEKELELRLALASAAEEADEGAVGSAIGRARLDLRRYRLEQDIPNWREQYTTLIRAHEGTRKALEFLEHRLHTAGWGPVATNIKILERKDNKE